MADEAKEGSVLFPLTEGEEASEFLFPPGEGLGGDVARGGAVAVLRGALASVLSSISQQTQYSSPALRRARQRRSKRGCEGWQGRSIGVLGRVVIMGGGEKETRRPEGATACPGCGSLQGTIEGGIAEERARGGQGRPGVEEGRHLERTRGVWMQIGHCSARRVHPLRSFSPIPVDTLLLFDWLLAAGVPSVSWPHSIVHPSSRGEGTPYKVAQRCVLGVW